MSRTINWSSSFRIVGALGELEGVCSSFLDGEIVDVKSFKRVSSLKANQLVLQVGGLQSLMDGLIFLRLIRRENNLLYTDRLNSLMLDGSGEERGGKLRSALFAENSIVCLHESDEVWSNFIDRVKFQEERILFPIGSDFIFLRDVLIGSHFLENENGNWIGLEQSTKVKEAAFLSKSRATLALRRKITQEDLEERIQEQRKLGELGERIVVRYENNRLHSIGHFQRCNHLAKVDCGAGYDIESYVDRVSKTMNRFLEVKSTSGFRGIMSIYLSRNEYETAAELGRLYSLILVLIGDSSARIFEVPSPLEKLGLTDVCWRPNDKLKFESLNIQIDLSTLQDDGVEIPMPLN